MTAAEKRKTTDAIRKVARWMSDPRHRVKDWREPYEFNEDGEICRTCIVGAFMRVNHAFVPLQVEDVAVHLKPNAEPFLTPWTTAELRKLFAESVKAVEAA